MRVRFASLLFTVGLGLVVVTASAVADQMIGVHATWFDKGASQFNVDVKGNKWVEVKDATSLLGTALSGPGDNDFGAQLEDGPFLIYKLPVNVKAGESTADGKKWQVWFHMRVPTDRNSFYWQFGTDGKAWKPSPMSNANRVNDDGMNGTNKWYWQNQLTGNDGAVDPILTVGVNYLRVGVREADALPNAPLFDAVIVRNYGKLDPADSPKDAEVKALLNASPVEPTGKAATVWGALRSEW
ncbi:hypothetical protein FJZ36_07020 [Candidatus Poribacteria bacterium]|nr:hypothetical protein [Candidatus Poribacteria bacterium]